MTQQDSPAAEAHARMAEAEKLRLAGRRQEARRICQSLVRKHPDYVAALHTLGLVLADGGDYEGALPHMVRAAMLNPRDWRTLTALSGVYLKLGSHVMAARTLEEALKYRPDDAATLAMLGEIHQEDEEHEQAAAAYERTVAADPRFTAAWIELGDTYMELGRLEEAAEIFERLYSEGVRTLRVCYHLGQLPARISNIDYRPDLENLSPSATADREDFASALAFARASILDKAGKHEDAWRTLQEANRYQQARSRASYERGRARRAASLDWLRRNAGGPRLTDRPLDPAAPISLFVLGPSRSGKTTIENALSTSDMVRRGYENSICDNVARRTLHSAGLLASDTMLAIQPPLRDDARRHYLEEVTERSGGARVFTITTPGLVMEVPALAQIVPNARFLFVKRDRDDIALRIFMKNYAAGNTYAYSLAGIHEYVDWYENMIDVLSENLPGISRTIAYEDAIASPTALRGTVAGLIGDGLPDNLSILGDDRGCAAPYRAMMQAARENEKR